MGLTMYIYRLIQFTRLELGRERDGHGGRMRVSESVLNVLC